MNKKKFKELKRKYSEKIEERKKRLIDFWNGKDIGRMPISFIPHAYEPRQIFNDKELQFEKAYKYFTYIMELPGDNIPIFWPDMGTISISSIFGGKIVSESNNDKLWIMPALNSIKDIEKIEIPDILTGLVKEEFERCKIWLDITDGFGYVAPPDMQGPINLAILIMKSEEFFVSIFNEPELVHRFLKICTETILKVIEVYSKAFGDSFISVNWPYIWIPKGKGMTITQDSLPFLSPEVYRNFELPYINEISKKIGGVFIHCCGKFEHILSELKKIKNLIGIDPSYPQIKIEKIVEVLGKNIVIIPNLNEKGYKEFPSYDKYVKHLVGILPPDIKLWYILPINSSDKKFDIAPTIETLKILNLNNLAEKLKIALNLLI